MYYLIKTGRIVTVIHSETKPEKAINRRGYKTEATAQAKADKMNNKSAKERSVITDLDSITRGYLENSTNPITGKKNIEHLK